ncbi:uncharacterized protein RHO25_005498 [Cercospora beticola]|uniref:Uncharacterized protein n=1 Tax=Cercospora beticola TaxID=122368 RepID=A0ABZ0NMV5_CERBT|nr:hypothetical protein RHO25_005498 [Cercospora beticola]
MPRVPTASFSLSFSTPTLSSLLNQTVTHHASNTFKTQYKRLYVTGSSVPLATPSRKKFELACPKDQGNAAMAHHLINPWSATNFQLFGGPYDEEYMTYWSNGGYGGGYGGYNYPMMMWQNGYNRGMYDRDMYAYLYGRGRNRHHRRAIRYHQDIHGNGNINNGRIAHFAGMGPFGVLAAPERFGGGAELMGMAMGSPFGGIMNIW